MKKLSGLGWLQFLIGILMIIMGIYALANPNGSMTVFVIICGIIAIIMGICDIVFYVKIERFTGFWVIVAMVSGILSIMVGIMLLLYPNSGKLLISLIFPIWFIAQCTSHLGRLSLVKIHIGSFYYYFSLVISIIGLIMGVLLLFEPVVSLLAASIVIGIYLIALGTDSIILAFSDT